MSAPAVDQSAPVAAPSPMLAANVPVSQEHEISPRQAGLAGAAVGLGAGLLVAEMLVPGVILAVIGLAGLAAGRGALNLFRRK